MSAHVVYLFMGSEFCRFLFFFVCLFLRHLAAKYTELVRLSVPAV